MMVFDIHAHYVPASLLAQIDARGAEIGVRLIKDIGPVPAVGFEYGFKVRPFFPKLIEPAAARVASLDRQKIDRQMIATWPDIYGYGLSPEACAAWHRILNDTLAEFCAEIPGRFAFVASVPLTSAVDAADELRRAAQMGAVAVMIPTNVEGVNIGELPLDPFWEMAQRLDLAVVLHPVLVGPAPRAAKFGLTQIVQYTSDTTFGVGSLLSSGVLDRFSKLRLVLPHGGGVFPYLLGRFDLLHGRMDKAAQGVTATLPPSGYLPRLAFDTIVHHPKVLRFLADLVGVDALALGTDESFPPADTDPLGSLAAAGFSAAEVRAMTEDNPRRLFPQLG